MEMEPHGQTCGTIPSPIRGEHPAPPRKGGAGAWINKHTKIFLDADVLVAGSYNPQGGSGFVLEYAKKRAFRIVTSKLVLQEAKRAIQEKLGEEALSRFYRNMLDIDFLLAPKPTQREVEKYSQLIHKDDVHVLAAAIKSKADFLITLNKKHFLTPKIAEANLNLVILTPKMFIEEYYKKLMPPSEK